MSGPLGPCARHVRKTRRCTRPTVWRSSLSQSSSARPLLPGSGLRSVLYIFAWLLLYFPSALSGWIKGPGLIFRTSEVEEASGREGEKCLSTHLKQQPASPPLQGGLELFMAAESWDGEDKDAETMRGLKTRGETGGLLGGRTAGCETAKEEDSDGCSRMQLDWRHGAHPSCNVPVQSAFLWVF